MWKLIKSEKVYFQEIKGNKSRKSKLNKLKFSW